MPENNGLLYFGFPCDTDEKIKKIQAEFGLKGFALAVMLFQYIYGKHGYYCEWNNEETLLFMAKSAVSCGEKNLVNNIVAACIRNGIFSAELFNKYRILTSSDIQETYLNGVPNREEIKLESAYLLLNSPKIQPAAGKSGKNVRDNEKTVKTTNCCEQVYINNNLNIKDNLYINNNKLNKLNNLDNLNINNNTLDINKNINYLNINNTCTQQQQNLPRLLLKDGTEYQVSENQISSLSNAYRNVDVLQELKIMAQWCLANPRKRKTRQGINRFINSWLNKANQRTSRSQTVKEQQKADMWGEFLNE